MRDSLAAKGLPVEMRDVTFSYGEMSMRFDAMFETGRISAVMGPSGSGKSTLLNLIAGFEQPASGSILIGGSDVSRLDPAHRPVSMIFQENNLFGHLDVFTNVALGLSPALKLTSGDRSQVGAALSRAGLAGKEKRLPRELSGGERQRVALARVLVRDRPVLLLDEPFASLGPALRREMLDLLLDLHARQGMTVVFVTHQPDDARHVAETLFHVDEGRIVASGPIEDMFGDAGSPAFKAYLGMERAATAARKPT